MLIVADDLSGAADCGIACVKAGLEAVVVLGDAVAPEAEVLAVDADTRGMKPEAAAARTSQMVRDYARPETALLFKKLDSTLRGNVGAEIGAMLGAIRAQRGAGAVAIVAPAFPATGRTTRGGHQFLHGAPVETTEPWRREGIVGIAHLPTMLGACGLRTATIDLAAIRGARLREAMMAARRGNDAIICDAETEADLEAIARAGITFGADTLWAGSAGLARHLPAASGQAHPGAAHPRPAMPAPVSGPILFVVGSLSGVSRAQVARLAEAPGTALVTVPPHVLRAGEGSAGWDSSGAMLDRAFAAGQDVLAVLGTEERVDMGEGLALCAALSRLVAPHAGRFSALVSTGGETARAILQGFGAAGLRLIGEIEPGVPLSVIEGENSAGHRLPVVTKAGAFGTPQTLLHCRAVLQGAMAMPALNG